MRRSLPCPSSASLALTGERWSSCGDREHGQSLRVLDRETTWADLAGWVLRTRSKNGLRLVEASCLGLASRVRLASRCELCDGGGEQGNALTWTSTRTAQGDSRQVSGVVLDAIFAALARRLDLNSTQRFHIRSLTSPLCHNLI